MYETAWHEMTSQVIVGYVAWAIKESIIFTYNRALFLRFLM